MISDRKVVTIVINISPLQSRSVSCHLMQGDTIAEDSILTVRKPLEAKAVV